MLIDKYQTNLKKIIFDVEFYSNLLASHSKIHWRGKD